MVRAKKKQLKEQETKVSRSFNSCTNWHHVLILISFDGFEEKILFFTFFEKLLEVMKRRKDKEEKTLEDLFQSIVVLFVRSFFNLSLNALEKTTGKASSSSRLQTKTLIVLPSQHKPFHLPSSIFFHLSTFFFEKRDDSLLHDLLLCNVTEIYCICFHRKEFFNLKNIQVFVELKHIFLDLHVCKKWESLTKIC